jgi:anti-sigma B factor antagonist
VVRATALARTRTTTVEPVPTASRQRFGERLAGSALMNDSLRRAGFVRSEGIDGHVVLRVSGEIDISATPLFNERLADVIAAGDDDVAVDLAEVTFIDSAGLTVLVLARQQLGAAGRKLLIARPSAPVTRVLEIAGLDVVFDIQG